MVLVGWYSKLIRFSSVFGWWMPTALGVTTPVASQPEKVTS